MTRQISTGRVGHSYEVVRDENSTYRLIVDNEIKEEHWISMEAARERANMLDMRSAIVVAGCIGEDARLSWETFIDDRPRARAR